MIKININFIVLLKDKIKKIYKTIYQRSNAKDFFLNKTDHVSELFLKKV
jgi:hypothetical protein